MSTPDIPSDLKEKLEKAYTDWAIEESHHSNGYTYEQSFLEMWTGLGKELFQDSVGQVPQDKNLKKTSNAIWKGSCFKS